MNGESLTHLDQAGRVTMVEVSAKEVTRRSAVAMGVVRCLPETVALLRAGELKKGDALTVARIAGIAAAKRTPDLLPLCHPIAITGIDVTVDLTDDSVQLQAEVRTADRTGIEMEALTAVSVAALNIIDMIKGVDRGAHIAGIWVESKEGGASGNWVRGVQQETASDIHEPREKQSAAHVVKATTVGDAGTSVNDALTGVTATVITVSDRCAAGLQDDRSGPVITDALVGWGAAVDIVTVPDDVNSIQNAIQAACAAESRVIVTTGGTGITMRDVTPEAVTPLLNKALPAMAAAIQSSSLGKAPGAMLSRTVAGTIGSTLVVCLPGSVNAAADGMRVLTPTTLSHALDQLANARHEVMP